LESGINRMAEALEENRQTLERRIQDATAELRGQKQAAEAAVLAKSRFLAAASHDLRQPLHALSLLVTALRERVREDEAKRLSEHIEASASAMETLLNALLDLSRLDAGVVEARPVCFPVNRVMKSVERQFAPLAQEKGLSLTVHPTDLWAYSDPALMERILANLVSNALRYTDKGRVLVGARRVQKDWIRLEVWDTGKGVPAEFQARIFEEYFQLENPERHRDKGLGLGLAIVARLAQLLGGRVSVRSQLGRGSCFGFRVARCAPALQQQASTIPASPGFALPQIGRAHV
jgi:signal transduction histidine kinase